MNKKMISLIIMTGIGMWYYKTQISKNVNSVLPKNTAFFIDPCCSDSLKKSMTHCMQVAYDQSKNPEEVITIINQNFPEINSIKVQICQSDKICFHTDLSKPIFLLNEQSVVCDNQVVVDKNKITPIILQNLITVFSDQSSYNSLIFFVQNLPFDMVKNFSIKYINDQELILTAKYRSDYDLIMQIDQKISNLDISMIENIIDKQKQLKAKKKRYICDIRFKNQIIIR